MNREMRKFRVETTELTDTFTVHEVWAESKEDAESRVHDMGEGELLDESEKGINWQCDVTEVPNE